MTRYIAADDISLPGSGSGYVMTEAEKAAWPLFAEWRASKQAVMVDPSSPRFFRGAGDGSIDARFMMVERAGGRLFVPHPNKKRHPHVVTDEVTGRSVLCFGAGGMAGNDLTPNQAGVLYAPSIVSGVVEQNAKPILLPNVGWSFAAKVRIPQPNSVANDIAFGSTVGGCIFGGGTTSSHTGAMLLEFRRSNGRLFLMNQNNIGLAHSPIFDFRDGAWHEIQAVFDRDVQMVMSWIDGVAQTPTTGVTADIGTTAGSDQVYIGGCGNTGGAAGHDEQFVGFLAFATWLPGPDLASTSNRALVSALMAER